jgi:hypothetical protein
LDSAHSNEVTFTVAPGQFQPQPLPAPVLTVSNGHWLTWSNVSGTVRYNIAIDATVLDYPSPGFDATSPFDLHTLNLGVGTHSITLFAIGNNVTNLTSPASNTVSFTVAPPPIVSVPPIHIEGTPENNVEVGAVASREVITTVTSSVASNPNIGNTTTPESLLSNIQASLPVGTTAHWSQTNPLVIIPATTTSTGRITGLLIIGSGASRTAIMVDIIIPMLEEEDEAEDEEETADLQTPSDEETAPRTLLLRLDSFEIQELNGDAPSLVMDVLPIVENGTTLLPVRHIAEALGAEVSWNEETREVTLTDGSTSIIFAIGEIVEGMEVPAQIVEGRTMVPLRFISEFFGADVHWDEEERSIEITI